MELLDYTTEAAMLPRQVCADLGQAVKRLSHAMMRAGLVSDAEALAADVLRRESEGGTALPEGLAMAHARSEAVDRICLSVATLTRPVPARAPDGEAREVDVVILLVGPPTEHRALLRVLARLVRAVRGGRLAAGLRAARDRQGLARALAAADTEVS
jgi:2-O-A-mannosyl-D-glycerate-specific PTS system IIC component